MSIVAAYAVCHPPLIIPTVGRGQEHGIQDTIDSYQEIARRVVAHRPATIIVTSPHAPLYRDAFHITTEKTLKGSMEAFRAPQTKVAATIDTELAKAIARAADEAGIMTAPSSWRDREMDHATFIPLWFIERAYEEANIEPDYQLVRIGLSGFPPAVHRTFGQAIEHAVEQTGRRTVFVASGDMSHKLKEDGPYGFAPEGPELDAKLCDIFENGEFDKLFDLGEDFCEAAAECGVRSWQIMAGALEGTAHANELLSYEGPFGVGYGMAAFEIEVIDKATADDDDDVDPYVALARASVEGYVHTGRAIERPDRLPDEMLRQRAGAFVSIHERGQLRGCIGTIAPTCSCVADEIIANGIAASTRDPRFDPITPDELDYLEISVDVLSPAEPISSPEELDPQRYGVIVTKGYRRGLLLPNLEGVDTVEEQLAIAKRKAGISPYDTDVELERFEVVRHERGGKARHE